MARHETIRKRSRSEIRKLMRKLNSQQRRELYVYAGPNLDFEKVPESVWQRWEAEIKEEFSSVIGIIFLLTWERIKQIIPFEWFGWPIESRRDEYLRRYQDIRGKFFSETYVENTRKSLSESTPEDRETALRRVLGPEREEIVVVTETSTVIPTAETDYATEIEKKNPNVKLMATWKHHDHRPPGHSRAEINPCPVCSPLEGLRSVDWPEKFKTGPPAHPYCDCHLEWEIVIAKQNE